MKKIFFVVLVLLVPLLLLTACARPGADVQTPLAGASGPQAEIIPADPPLGKYTIHEIRELEGKTYLLLSQPPTPEYKLGKVGWVPLPQDMEMPSYCPPLPCPLKIYLEEEGQPKTWEPQQKKE
ncbi:MAG: hypothetical protein HYV77_00060 [Candidatus Wildermuthbacteria bacterium]|nr:hypothetical protein [Candidatus Wildermuthbacteria bacterium]